DGQQEPAWVDVFDRDVIRTAQAMIAYPFSTFRRLELGVSGTSITRDRLVRGYTARTGSRVDEDFRLFDAAFVQPVAALVFDNSLFGATGPIYGRRYRLQASRTLGEYTFSEFLLDFRNYWNWKRRVVFASRLIGLVRTGQDADWFAVYWGGPYFLRGYDGNSFDVDSDECRELAAGSVSRCPVRDQLIGSSAAIMNLELRFPIITELQ